MSYSQKILSTDFEMIKENYYDFTLSFWKQFLFMEFTSVKVTDAFNHLFDIEKTQKKIYSLIANHLSIKFFNCTILKSKILLTIIVVLQKSN